MSRPQYPGAPPPSYPMFQGSAAPPGSGPVTQSPVPERTTVTAPASPYAASAGTSKNVGSSSPAAAFILIGAVLLVMLSAIPIWNAAILLQDANYMFWAGALLPKMLIGACIGVLVLYVATVATYFNLSGPQAQTEQTIMMMANLFIMLLGLALVLVSLPLSRQSVDTYDHLMTDCSFDNQAQFLREYSQVLHNIRGTPDCMARHSVEECAGYEAVPPYTTALKAMEEQYRCTGFCHAQASAAAASLLEAEAYDGAGAESRARRRFPRMPSVREHLGFAAQETQDGVRALFTANTFDSSCEGPAARAMKTVAGDIGVQTFYQGIYLMNLAVLMGFLKLLGYCVRRDQSNSILKPPY